MLKSGDSFYALGLFEIANAYLAISGLLVTEVSHETLDELEEQIELTVVHEIAHFFGIEEERLVELGYE